MDNAPIKFVPFDPDELQIYKLDPKLTPDNVLKHCLGNLKSVALIGVDEDGEWYCASSEPNPKKVMKMIKKFKSIIKDYID